MDRSEDARQAQDAEGTPPGDPLEAAFAQYQGELLGMLYYLLGNSEDARDAFQEAFVKCWRRREKLAEVVNLRAWVFRVALNVGRDFRGTAWRRRRRSLPDDESAVPASPNSPPDADLLRREQLALVQRALHGLRIEEREVFLLRQNGEMTYEEIAVATDLPVGTVKTRMRLALEKLRQKLDSHGD